MAQGKITGRTSQRARSTQAVSVGTARTGKARGKSIAGYGGRIASGSRGGTADQALNASAKALGRSAPGTGGASVGGVGGGGGLTETTTGPGGSDPGGSGRVSVPSGEVFKPVAIPSTTPLGVFPGTDYPSPVGMKSVAAVAPLASSPTPMTRASSSDAVVSAPAPTALRSSTTAPRTYATTGTKTVTVDASGKKRAQGTKKATTKTPARAAADKKAAPKTYAKKGGGTQSVVNGKRRAQSSGKATTRTTSSYPRPRAS